MINSFWLRTDGKAQTGRPHYLQFFQPLSRATVSVYKIDIED